MVEVSPARSIEYLLNREADGALYMVIEVAMILIYICVLLIKTCDPSLVRSSMVDDARFSKAICSAYGLGDTASGKSAACV